jgi:Arc/MetJ family transcription regulator
MCDILHISGGAIMPTNLAIDDRLIDEAKRVGKHKTKKEAVTAALDEYIRWRKQMEILNHFGTIDFDTDYDYKKMRQLDRIEIEE